MLIVVGNGVLVALVVVASLWLYRNAQSDARFDVRHVTVTGAKHSSQSDIDLVARSFRGANLFQMNIESVQAELRRLPWVDSVAIEKKLPDTLLIRLTEREAVALVRKGNDFHYVDAAGVVFAPLSLAVGDAELPIISRAGTSEVARCVAFLLRVKKSDPALYSRISEVAPVAPAGLMVIDRVIGAPVFMQEEDAISKWRRFYQIYQAENLTRASIEYADLRFAKRIVMKPKKELMAQAAPVVVASVIAD